MTAPRPWLLATIRVRLTLLYAGAFFLAGVTVVVLLYLSLGRTLEHQLTMRGVIPDQTLQHESRDVHEAFRAQFERARDDTLDTMLIASLAVLAVMGIIAAGCGWLLAGRALRPLRQITATARRIADRSLHERVALVGPHDEIKELADTVDAMLERLDRAFEGQRRFVANASHELRTPLTLNRTLIEVALGDPQASEPLRQLGTTLLAVNQRHERLIDGLLTLASSDQGVSERTPVDLADIARRITSESHAAAQLAGVAIRVHLQPAPVAGDPVLLERLIQNLVDNAIRYNRPADGRVTVTTAVVDGDAHLTVENTGPPVPPTEVPGLFEPFRRLPNTERLADSASTPIGRGAGLGLSIVRSVAHAHGGNVHASAREDGGLTVLVRIPALLERSARNGADWNTYAPLRGRKTGGVASKR